MIIHSMSIIVKTSKMKHWSEDASTFVPMITINSDKSTTKPSVKEDVAVSFVQLNVTRENYLKVFKCVIRVIE